MSNGIGHVWAVNAEGGDQGRPNGVGPVWIENADQLGSKLPEPESGDAGKVLGVLNSSGDIGWVVDQSGTFTQVQADWDETDSSKASYIDNKPSLATVATSGSYNDLNNKPDIPTYTAGNGIDISGQDVISSNASSSDFVYGQTSEIRSSNYASNNSFWYPYDGDGRDAPSTIKCIRSIEIGYQDYTLHWVTGTAGQAYVSTFSVDVRYGVRVGDILNLPNKNRSSDWVDGVTPIGVNPIYLTIAGSTGGTAPNGEEVVALRADATTPYFVSVENPTTMYLKNPLPASTALDANKVLTVNNSGAAAWTTPATVTVDQSYNAASTNAQSGTAVAQAIAAIPSAPSYTAGDGIDIVNNAIAVKYNSNTLDTVASTVTITAAGTPEAYDPYMHITDSGFISLLNGQTAANVTVHIPSDFFSSSQLLGMQGYTVFLALYTADPRNGGQPAVYTYAPLSYQYDSLNDEYVIDEQDVVLSLPASGGNWYPGTSLSFIDPYIVIVIAMDPNMGTSTPAQDITAESSTCTITYASAGSQALTVKNPLPASAVGDAGKVLKVDSNGDPEWATGGAQADWTESDPSDPSYVQNKPDVLSFVAGSGISITESASSITIAADAQIPSYSTTTDVGKVLQVTANGLAWVTLS